MLRIVLILGLIIVGVLQGVNRGDVDLDNFAMTALEQTEFDTVKADGRQCCDERLAGDDKRSICKPDCKAVITIAVIKPHKLSPDYGRPRQSSVASVKNPVDLRPPIS